MRGACCSGRHSNMGRPFVHWVCHESYSKGIPLLGRTLARRFLWGSFGSLTLYLLLLMSKRGQAPFHHGSTLVSSGILIQTESLFLDTPKPTWTFKEHLVYMQKTANAARWCLVWGGPPVSPVCRGMASNKTAAGSGFATMLHAPRMDQGPKGLSMDKPRRSQEAITPYAIDPLEVHGSMTGVQIGLDGYSHSPSLQSMLVGCFFWVATWHHSPFMASGKEPEPVPNGCHWICRKLSSFY